RERTVAVLRGRAIERVDEHDRDEHCTIEEDHLDQRRKPILCAVDAPAEAEQDIEPHATLRSRFGGSIALAWARRSIWDFAARQMGYTHCPHFVGNPIIAHCIYDASSKTGAPPGFPLAHA